jgi:hypothetical protein
MLRSRRKSGAFAVLLVALFALWWGVALISSRGGSISTTALPGPAVDSYVGGPIAVEHSVLDGMDVYHGSVALPSACDTLGTGLATRSGTPPHLTITLTINKTPGCGAAQGSDAEPFAVSVSRQKTPPVLDGVTVNGVIVSNTLAEGS